MTIKEAILSNSILSEFEGTRIEKAMISRSVNGREVYAQSSLKEVELITADLYSELLVSPEIKEGGLSIKYDKGNLRDYIKRIGTKYEDEALLGSIPKIKPLSEW